MSVNIKTLRIGSHVQHHGKRKMVHSMGGDTVYLLPSIVNSVVHIAKTDDIEPILITPEILTEIGFRHHGYDNGKLWEWDLPDKYKCYGYLEFDEDTTTIWRGRLWCQKEVEMEFKVEFLHELENLFYVIYGVELIKEGE